MSLIDNFLPKNKQGNPVVEGEKPVDVIPVDMAIDEFNRFCEVWEIDYNDSGMKSDDKVDFESLKNKIVKAIQKGRLCLNEDNTLSYTISDNTENPKKRGATLIIKRPKGDAYLSMDKYKEGQGMHKFNALLGAMTNHAPEYFSDIDGLDLKPIQAVVQLFLAD